MNLFKKLLGDISGRDGGHPVDDYDEPFCAMHAGDISFGPL